MKFTVTAKEPTTAVKLLGQSIDVSLYDIKKQLRAREIKVDGVRIGADCPVEVGTTVEIFVPERMIIARRRAEIVYRDERVVVAFKYADTPFERVADDLGLKLHPVHRLDRNTAGLIAFALDEAAQAELVRAVKIRAFDKRYYAEVAGCIEKGATATAYLRKDAATATVKISDTPRDGYVEIVTQYAPIEQRTGTTLLDIGLITGRTHQIRAYFAHIGHPVVGDGKYGDAAFNGKMHAKTLRLAAYRLTFGGLTGDMAYLNGKIIEAEKEKIDFIY